MTLRSSPQGRNPHRHAGLGHHRVIAALGDERDACAEPGGEVARPDPGRQDDLISLSAALVVMTTGLPSLASSMARTLSRGSRRPFPQQRGQRGDQPVGLRSPAFGA
jgi:hypothetical protein